MTRNNSDAPLLTMGMFSRKFKKIILNYFKNFGFFGSEGPVLRSITFLPDVPRSQIFTRLKTTQGLPFKPFRSFGTDWVLRFKAKNWSKHDKQRHLVSKMKFEMFFVEAQDPFHNYTTVLGRYYYPVPSQSGQRTDSRQDKSGQTDIGQDFSQNSGQNPNRIVTDRLSSLTQSPRLSRS